MSRLIRTIVLSVGLCMASVALPAQDVSNFTTFTVDGRTVQIHGFISQGFAYSTGNNYLTMLTTQGSFALTEGAVNISTDITDKFRVGAQMYVRNVGELGRWRPELDWASGSYKFKDWFRIRAGKVKTVLGLYNDTQDMEFLHTWAILPQSLYPLDLRALTIAHTGGDIYGGVSLKKGGTLSYTAYAGKTPEDPNGGYEYGLTQFGLKFSRYGGHMEGGDLRWSTPLSGLLLGVSYMNEYNLGLGTQTVDGSPHREESRSDATSGLYAEYIFRGLTIDAEYRRHYRDQWIYDLGGFSATNDSRSWYAAAAYRFNKRLELGGYYSRFNSDVRTDTSLPNDHIYDRVITARVDLSTRWSLKIEGHFIDGYGALDAIHGFYPQQNPAGFQPKTNLLVIRTAWNF